MPKFNPDSQLNIHDLAIQEIETQEAVEIPFDPNKLLAEADWAVLQEITTDSPTWILEQTASLAILDKDKLPEMSIKIKDKIKKKIRDDLWGEGHLQDMAWASYISPEFTNVPAEAFERAVEKSNDHLSELRDKKDWRHFFEYASWLTVLGRRPNLSQEDFKELEEEFKSQEIKAKEEIVMNNGDAKAYDTENFLEDAVAMSIIYPDYPLKISAESSKLIVAYLQERIRHRALAEWYISLAMARIVADKCIEVNKKKRSNQETQQLPESKQF